MEAVLPPSQMVFFEYKIICSPLEQNRTQGEKGNVKIATHYIPISFVFIAGLFDSIMYIMVFLNSHQVSAQLS